MESSKDYVPDSTAIRVALWRALHLEVDGTPAIFQDDLGMKLVNPPSDWRSRPDMHPLGTRGYRAGIVSRARFIEDLVEEKMKEGIDQYVILGAGLDTFAQRRGELSSKLKIFEIDQKETQDWKENRLQELGFTMKPNHHFVAVDFEAGESWIEKLVLAGFDISKPAVVVSTGVAMYLTKEANFKLLQEVASLASKSVFAMSFILTVDLMEESERPMFKKVMENASSLGTPFLSLFTPEEVKTLATEAGFSKVHYIDREEIIRRYFSQREDGLLPTKGEEIIVCSVK